MRYRDVFETIKLRSDLDRWFSSWSIRDRDFEMTKTLDNKNPEIVICDFAIQSQQLIEISSGPLIILHLGALPIVTWSDENLHLRNSEMRDHDLIVDRWIKRTRGERSEHHKAPSRSFAHRNLELWAPPSKDQRDVRSRKYPDHQYTKICGPLIWTPSLSLTYRDLEWWEPPSKDQWDATLW